MDTKLLNGDNTFIAVVMFKTTTNMLTKNKTTTNTVTIQNKEKIGIP